MTAFLDSIPTFEMTKTAESSAKLARFRRPAGDGAVNVERRTFLRLVVAGGGALAMTVLGWVGERTRAVAATRTSMYPGHCLDGDAPGDTPCWGTPWIGGQYCAGDGYHRIDTVSLGYDGYRVYHWAATCGGEAGWWWYSSANGYRSCWDGDAVDYYYGGGSTISYNICLRAGAS